MQYCTEATNAKRMDSGNPSKKITCKHENNKELGIWALRPIGRQHCRISPYLFSYDR